MINPLNANIFGSEENYVKYQKLQAMKKSYRRGEVSLAQLMGADEGDEEKTDTEKCVDSLYETCTALNKRGKESLFHRQEEELTQKAAQAAATFVSAYNELLKTGGEDEREAVVRNTAYLRSIVNPYAGKLEKVGISIEESGLLILDTEKWKASDLMDQRDVFVGNDSLVGKVQQKLFEISLADSGMAADTTGTYGKNAVYMDRPNGYSSYDSRR